MHRYALLQFDPGPQLLAAAARAGQQQVASAEPKELVYLLWAFAKIASRPLQPNVAALVKAALQPLCTQLSDAALQPQVVFYPFTPSLFHAHVQGCMSAVSRSNGASDP